MSFLNGPRLLNSANVWATSKEELQALYECDDTGAVTMASNMMRVFINTASGMPIQRFSTRASLKCRKTLGQRQMCRA